MLKEDGEYVLCATGTISMQLFNFLKSVHSSFCVFTNLFIHNFELILNTRTCPNLENAHSKQIAAPQRAAVISGKDRRNATTLAGGTFATLAHTCVLVARASTRTRDEFLVSLVFQKCGSVGLMV